MAKQNVINLLLMIVSILIVLAVASFFVKERYSYVHLQKADLADRRIDLINRLFKDAKGEVVHWSRGKARCSNKVLVVGDSYIFGDGIPMGASWDYFLSHMIASTDESICVYAVGKNGWSTQEQLHYLEKNIELIKPNYVIFGFVINDPDVGDVPKRYLKKKKPSKWNLLNFSREGFKKIRSGLDSDLGYPNWIEKLYSNENLAKWGKRIRALKVLVQDAGATLVFVMTPSNPSREVFENKYAKVKTIFETEGVEYVDLLPSLSRDFYGIVDTYFHTNPGDPHPSATLSSYYAYHAYLYLCREEVLTSKCNDLQKILDKVAYQDGN